MSLRHFGSRYTRHMDDDTQTADALTSLTIVPSPSGLTALGSF